MQHVEIEFQFLSSQDQRQGRVVMTPEMLNLQWNSVSMYPAGYFARQINIEPSRRTLQHSGIGLARRMVGMRERTLAVAMMRTGIDGIEMRAFRRER